MVVNWLQIIAILEGFSGDGEISSNLDACVRVVFDSPNCVLVIKKFNGRRIRMDQKYITAIFVNAAFMRLPIRKIDH